MCYKGFGKFSGKWLRRISHKTKLNIFRFAQKISKDTVIIDRLLASPAEELENIGRYDIAVMVNVIEHCFDFHRIGENLTNLLQPGGLLVFSDKLYNHETIEQQLSRSYDAMHPLKVDESVIMNYLETNYESLYRRIQHRVKPDVFAREEIYFIGHLRY